MRTVRYQFRCGQSPLIHQDISTNEPVTNMLYWTAVFFVIAVIAAVFGFGGIAAASAEIAKILFFIFVALFLISLIFSLVNRRKPPL